jgi:hypothetical protein
MAVMIGGVLSTVLLGTMVDKGNLYADLAAESYLQAENDPEFWKNLTEEEQKKAKEMLVAIKQAKEGGDSTSSARRLNTYPSDDEELINTGDATKTMEKDTPKTLGTKATNDIFSDYD